MMAGHYFYDPRPFYGHNGHTGLMPLDELFYGRYDPVVPYWMDQRMMSFDDTFYKQQLASRRGGPEVMQQQYLPQRGENNFMPYKRPELVRDDMYTDLYTRRSPYNFNYSNYGRDGFALSAPMQFRGQQSQDDNWVHAMSAPPAHYGHGQGYRGLPEPPPGGMPTRTGIDQFYQNNQGGEQYRQMDTPANTHMMSNQNKMASNMASNMVSNMSNRDTHGNSHGNNQGNSHGNNQGNTHGNNQGNTHGNNQGNSHGNNQGNTHGNSQGNTHGNSQGNTHGNNQGNSHGNNQGNSRGNNQGNTHGNSQGNSHGNNQGNSQGTKQMGFSGTQTGNFGKSVGKSSSMQTSKQTTINNTKRYDSSSSSDSEEDDDDRHGHNNGSNKWGTVVKSTHGHGGKVSSSHGHKVDHSSGHGYESNARGLKSSSHSTSSKKSSSHGHSGQSKISRLLGFGDDSSSSEDESYGHGGARGSSKGSSKGSANHHDGHVASFQPNYGAQPKQMQFSSQSKSVELKVPICCDNCERKVRSCLQKMHGVESVLCDQWNRKVIVYGNLKADDVLKRVRRVKKTSELWSQAKQQQQLMRLY